MENLFEIVKSIRNRCNLLLKLSVAYPIEEIRNEIPTMLKDIYEDSEEIIEKHCIEGKDEPT